MRFPELLVEVRDLQMRLTRLEHEVTHLINELGAITPESYRTLLTAVQNEHTAQAQHVVSRETAKERGHAVPATDVQSTKDSPKRTKA